MQNQPTEESTDKEANLPPSDARDPSTLPMRANNSLPSEPNDRIASMEAILWLASEPLPLRRLAKLADLADMAEARECLKLLQKKHRARRSAFEITEVAGGFQLLTKPQYAPWLRDTSSNSPLTKLSTPSMETLAIVAYRQPVLRAEIEAIRGVGCGELLRQLLEGDLLRIVGRSEELGRPLLYGTTKRFLQLFGLRNLEGLAQSVGASELRGPTYKDEHLGNQESNQQENAAEAA